MINVTKTLSLFTALLLAACSGTSDFKAHQHFVDNVLLTSNDIKRKTLRQNDFTLHYAEKGDAKDAVLLWLHGTPGAWTEVGHLMTDNDLLKTIKVVSVDRPGWGSSVGSTTLVSRYVEFDTQNQLISPLITQLKQDHPDTPLYLAGHSWGASLAPYIAAMNAEQVDGLILFAGAYFAELAQPRWYNHLSRLWPINKIIGEHLRLANAEMFALPRGLEKLSSHWPALEDKPLLAIQGADDFLVNPKNADHLNTVRNSKNTRIAMDTDYGHLWHIQRPDVISQCIRAAISANLNRCEQALQQQ